MASAPVYFTVAKVGFVRLTTGVTATDGSVSSTAITWSNTAPTADWFISKIVVSSTSATGVGDLADSLLHMFVDDGTTVRLHQSFDLGNPAAGTTAAGAYQNTITIGPEFVFPSTVLPEFTVSVTPTAGNVDLLIYAQSSQ